MKLQLSIVAVIATLLLLAGTAAPQMERQFTVDIPFDFVAAGVHLSAGTYNIFHIVNSSTMLIWREDGKAGAQVPLKMVSQIAPGKATTKLVFNTYGDQQFLEQIWTGRDQQVHECYRCPAEEALANQVPKVTTLTATPKK